MRFDVRTEGGIAVIEPVGDIDGKTAPEFQAQMLPHIQSQPRIVLNLAQVAFMSSAGLRTMLLIYREAKARNARLVLAGVNKDIRGSMSATGFLSFFTLREDVTGALQELG